MANLVYDLLRAADRYTPQDWLLVLACLVLLTGVVVMARK